MLFAPRRQVVYAVQNSTSSDFRALLMGVMRSSAGDKSPLAASTLGI